MREMGGGGEGERKRISEISKQSTSIFATFRHKVRHNRIDSVKN